MPVFLELIMVVALMLLFFFAIFLVMFLVAIALLPVEKSLSKVVWEMTAPPKRKTPAAQPGGFKGFSEKQKNAGK